MGRLRDRVAIVTGAGQGIGHGVARALAAEGAKIVVANRTPETGQRVAIELEAVFAECGARALFVATDVSQQQSVCAMVEETVRRFGGVDILINNATPNGALARLERMSSESMDEFVRVNHHAVFWAMQAVFPHMKAKGFGRIITMCSLNGINAHRYTAGYNASKEAARALARTAAVEWGQYGITSNVICPAAVTPPWELFQKYDPAGAANIVAANPMRRMGDAEADIGPLAVFLASEESRYITGNTIHADGGGHINGVPWRFELPAGD